MLYLSTVPLKYTAGVSLLFLKCSLYYPGTSEYSWSHLRDKILQIVYHVKVSCHNSSQMTVGPLLLKFTTKKKKQL